MKIGAKEEMGVADEMTSSVLGSRARSARICAQSAQIHSFSWFWGKSGSKNCQRVVKIGMKEEMGIADEMRSSNLESRVQYTLLRAKRAQRAMRAPLLC